MNTNKLTIDFVLPWVDPNDTEWQKSKRTYENDGIDAEDNSIARYRDMETLRYVLRSIEKNCPWYNKIYLITEGHAPEWLDVEHERIELVTHADIYADKSHLPTFNSSSIEMNLAHIPNLSEHFVYLNDDMLIMRETSQERFFVDNKPVDFFVVGALAEKILFFRKRELSNWDQMIRKSLKLVVNEYGMKHLNNSHLYHESYGSKEKAKNFALSAFSMKPTHLKVWHHPQPYKKSTLDIAHEKFGDEMMECSKSRFRDPENLTQYLYRYIQLITANFHPFYHNDAVKNNSISSLDEFNKMKDSLVSNTALKFVCFNDSPALKEQDYEVVKVELQKFLAEWFTDKATFER